jgi:hypothetical protein
MRGGLHATPTARRGVACSDPGHVARCSGQVAGSVVL